MVFAVNQDSKGRRKTRFGGPTYKRKASMNKYVIASAAIINLLLFFSLLNGEQAIVCSQQQALFCDDFSNGLNPLWTQDGSCTWNVSDGQVRASLSGCGLACALKVQDTTWTDYTFEYDVRGNAGVDKAVVFRINETQGYVFSIRSDWSGDEAYLHVPGINYAQIVQFPSQNGVWYHVEISCQGNHIVVKVDGTKIIDYIDVANSCPTGGIIVHCGTGMACVCDVSFDNVVVKAIYSGPTWHVATNGDDVLGDGSSAYPFATVQRGINAAANGDTVLVLKGEYGGTWSILSKSIFIIAANPAFHQTVVMPGSNGESIIVDNCDSVSVEGFYFFNDVEPQVQSAISIRSESTCSIRRSVVYTPWLANSIHCDPTSKIAVRQCALKSSECTIDLMGSNSSVINCTFLGGSDAICVSGDSALILNNAILNYSNAGIVGADLQCEVDYNLFWNNSVNYMNSNQGVHDLVANPLFDCLTAIDIFCDFPAFPPRWSPCKNAGIPIPEYNDPDGTRNDIGAFYRSSQTFIPDDYPFLSEALSWAVDGDSIVYRSGVHAESSFVDIWDLRDIWIVGEEENQSSILEPAVAGKSILKLNPSVSFNEFDPIESDWHVANLVFRNSEGAPALWVQNNDYQGFVVHNCRFEDNQADSGAGLYLIADEFADCSVGNNDFVNNGGGFGVALFLECPLSDFGYQAVSVTQNRFVGNTGISIFETSALGLGIELEANSNLFHSNVAVLHISNGGCEWSAWTGNRWIKNIVSSGGCVHDAEYARTSNIFAGNSLILNSFPNQPGVAVNARGRHLYFERNLIALTENGSGAVISDTTDGFLIINVTCNDSWGNDLGNYLYSKLDSTNISEDPLLCDTSSVSLALYNISPCLPEFNQCGVKIGADTIGCLGPPSISAPGIQDEMINNVVSVNPTFFWRFHDYSGLLQTAFEIAVGTDNDWQFSEMWNPAPFVSADTFVVYNGAPLVDGATYWLRLRVNNGLAWSEWSELTFRMNSVPGVPEMRLPVDLAIVNTEHPTLVVRNPSDAENDSMLITFELSADSFATSIFPIEVKMSSDSLTSLWVNFPLNEDLRFWWRVTASDYYEESGYSQVRSFWINSVNSTPTAFSLLSPPNGASPALPFNVPEFTWQNSLDIDPGDSVKFTLQLAIDPSFSFMSQITGLTSPNYLPATPLEWGRRYWWRVKAEDKSTGVRWSNETFDFKIMALGDADGSGTVTISDVVYLINYIFGGGPAPNPIESGDADCSGAVTISDVVYLINYIFAGTAAPCEG